MNVNDLKKAYIVNKSRSKTTRKIVGLNLKNARNQKKAENSKMAKFEAHGIKG